MMELIAAGRRELAGVLDGLDDARWHGPSLCAGWSVAHVVAHLTMPFRISAQEFALGMQRAGGRFTEFSDGVADRDSRLPRAELVSALRDNAENPWAPPGGGLPGALTHDVVHGLDITWPLSVRHTIPDAATTTVLDLLTGQGGRNPFGFDTGGLRLEAADLDWSSGTGSLLRGDSRDLLLLLAGRRVPSERFSGPGAQRLGAASR